MENALSKVWEGVVGRIARRGPERRKKTTAGPDSEWAELSWTVERRAGEFGWLQMFLSLGCAGSAGSEFREAALGVPRAPFLLQAVGGRSD